VPREASRRSALRCEWSFWRLGKGAGGSEDEGEVVSSRSSEGVLGEMLALPGDEVEAGSSGSERMTEEMWRFREAWMDFVSSIDELRDSSRARVRVVGASGSESRMLEVASRDSLASAAIS
jgi:hypothetical protein